MQNPLLAPLLAIASGILISRTARFETPELAIALGLLLVLTLVAVGWRRRIVYAPLLPALCLAGIWWTSCTVRAGLRRSTPVHRSW
jgi:hypothetical protein